MSDVVVTKLNGIAFVDFAQTEILDLAQTNAIGGKLRALAESKEAFDMLIDFRRVRLITSSMIGELIKLKQKCEELSIELKFCNLSSDLAGLLKKLKLDKSFNIFATREQALKAIQTDKKRERL